MANTQSVTVCNGCKLHPSVAEYLNKFRFIAEDMHVVFGPKGEFEFYGYDWPIICKKNDDDQEDASDEFFDGLKEFVPKRKQLVIQSISYQACRFPVSGMTIVITKDKVDYTYLPN